ncbi:sugar ABC transporter ATP-binding protein [Paraburkholderia domus]|uniref:sugar ABC transporter ATP-binding protein n=1 Tax=Paraburkholderia domus TaxID=2793075 RepID=UPI001912A2C9|nr:sugar ABC transporter ATP-binding protein [Paraburkholderia domus]MBK5065963.1 sugar ABC transporter ATP-binding protein [Burkholderia sp. R-70199]CAE6965418.1 Galactose/methyl galactoside import ATP-binding protein MglA [Paraburkholderia domus]
MNALEVKGISKSYPGVRALDRIEFSCSHGSVHALVGENGAGKSTLIKILSGATSPDEGELVLDGKPYSPDSPSEAVTAGVSTIYQEFNLIPGLSVAENIFLGRERIARGLLDAASMRREARALLKRIGAPIDVRRRVGTLSVAEQQLVEIAKALAVSARVLIMDEPSATLSDHEMTLLYNIVRNLSREGVTILYVSHRMDEIFDLCDTCTIMKDGRSVCTRKVAELDRASLIRLMVGREVDTRFPDRRHAGDDVTAGIVLDVKALRLAERVKDVTFNVRAGEIVGLAGLVGAGRTEVARAIFGLDDIASGEISLRGRAHRPKTPAEAIDAGVALVPEDRKAQGLVLGLSIRENAMLPTLASICRLGFINRRREQARVASVCQQLAVSASSAEVPVGTLSGGNQQKVVFGKWIAHDYTLLILDEPTRGVDVGAKVEFYRLIDEIARSGKAVLLISSEMPELIGMADRIVALRDGVVTGEASARGATEESILHMIAR